MAPLIVLVVIVLVARLIGQLGVAHLRDWAASTRVGLAVMLCFTAAAHFNSMRPDMVAMVPPGVPNPEFMVTFTGICEILGAVGLLVPRTRRIAAVALIVFLLAVLPANIHAAQAGVTLRGAPATPLVPRVALQVLFIGLLWWSGVRSHRAHKPSQNTQRVAFLAAAIIALGLGPAQESSADFVGTWELSSIEERTEDGDWIPVRLLDGRPIGIIMYDDKGNMAVQITTVPRSTETPAESPDLVHGYVAYYGRYEVDAQAGTVTHHRRNHINPDLGSLSVVRDFTFSGDTLTLTPAPARQTRLNWVRMR